MAHRFSRKTPGARHRLPANRQPATGKPFWEQNLAPGSQFREPMLLAVPMARGLSYDDSDAPSFTLPNEVDVKLQKIYAKAYSELTDVQMFRCSDVHCQGE